MKNILLIPIFIIMLLITLTGALASEVSYYDFEENTGTNLIDQWNTQNATLINGGSWNSTYPSFDTSGSGADYSIQLDGANDYVNLISDFYPDNLSFNIWVYEIGTSANEVGILRKSDDGTNLDNVGLMTDGAGGIKFQNEYSAGNYVRLEVPNSLNNKEWTMITILLSSSNSSLWVNGEMKIFSTSANFITGAYDMSTNWKLGNNQQVSTRYFNGLMDEVKIWDDTKNSTEISNLYNYGTITHPTSNNDTTLKVAEIPFNDFNFSSDVYQTFKSYTINKTENTTILVDDVFNFEKISGSGDSLVSVRWIINGDTSAEHDLVTLSGSSNNKRVVNHQRSVNLIAGVNNISLQIKRTGIGTITLFNSLGIITSSRDEFGDQLDFKEIDVNTTCLGVGSFTSCGTPQYTSRFNQSLLSWTSASMSSGNDDYFLKLGLNTPVTSRTLDTGDVGAISSNWIYNASDENDTLTIYQYSDGVSDFDIDGHIFFLGTKTNESKELSFFNTTGSSTHLSTTSYGTGNREILNYTFDVINDNNGYYFNYDGHIKNNLGDVGTATWTLSVDGEDCSASVERTHSKNGIGSIGLIKVCDGLSSGSHIVRINLSLSGSNGWDLFDDMLVGIETSDLDLNVLPDTEDPVVSWTFPNYPDWSNLTINGTCTDNELVSSVSIDSDLFTNTGSSPNAWEFTYIGAYSLTSTNLTITCVDDNGNTGSSSQVLGVDNTVPVCLGISNQNLISGENYTWSVNCSDDLNLYSVNVSCSGGSAFSFFKDEINALTYNVTNNTGALTSSMVCLWETTDAHTLGDITEELNSINTFYYNDGLIIDGFKYIGFDTSDSDSVDSIELDFTTKKDRVKFKVKPTKTKKDKVDKDKDKDKVNKKDLVENKLTFYVNAKYKLSYIENDLFPAWFVIDDYYWVDFEVLNSEEIDYQVHKINDTTYRVIVTGKVQDYFDFNSLGIVNTMNYLQSFTVSQPSLSFGVACGNSYVDRNVSFNFSSNGLHDCSLYVNGLVIEENFNCSDYVFSSFIGRNKFLLTGLDSYNVSQSDVCNIYVNPQDKNFSDMIPVFILLGIVGLMFVLGGKYYLFDVLGFIISIPLALELVPFVNAFALIIPAALFLFLVVRKRRE